MVAGTRTRELTASEPEAVASVVGADLLVGTLPKRRRVWVMVAFYLLTVFILITINFLLPRVMPGDPIDAMFAFGSPTAVRDDVAKAKLEKYYGLDKPLSEQYVNYLTRLVHGDLGVSVYPPSRPVSKELRGRIGWTFLLIGAATVIAILIGIPAGVHSGWKRGHRVDKGLLTFFVTAQNIPVFVLAMVSLVVLSAQLGLFPLDHAETPFANYTGLRHVVDIAHHVALPALLLAFDFIVYEYLIMRSSMVSELGSDYLLGGRAKGLRERRLKYGYAGRNALLPVFTVIGLQFSLAITSVVFIERIFSYPGVGGYMFNAIGTRDYPAMQGAFLVLTITVVTTNLVVDLIYRRIDPRAAT